jgi:outer membrane protein assembly factor BamB
VGRVGWVTRRQALAGLGVAAIAGCGSVNAAVRQGSLSKPPGALLWRIAVPGGVTDLELAGGLLCVAGGDVRAYRPGTGRLAWRRDMSVLSLTVMAGGQFAVVNGSRIQGLDAATGQTAWTFDVPYLPGAWATRQLSYAAGHLYTCGPATGHALSMAVIALDSRTGRPAWQASLPWSDDVVQVVPGDGIVYAVGLTRLIALDAVTGKILWTASGPMTPQAAGVAGDVVYGFATGSRTALLPPSLSRARCCMPRRSMACCTPCRQAPAGSCGGSVSRNPLMMSSLMLSLPEAGCSPRT